MSAFRVFRDESLLGSVRIGPHGVAVTTAEPGRESDMESIVDLLDVDGDPLKKATQYNWDRCMGETLWFDPVTPERHAMPSLGGMGKAISGAIHTAGRHVGLIPHPEPVEHAPTGMPDGKTISAALAGGAPVNPIRASQHGRVYQTHIGGRPYAIKEFHAVDNPDLHREAAWSEVSQLAGVRAPKMRQVTIHPPGSSPAGVQALVSDWVEGHPISALPQEEAVQRMRAVPKDRLSRSVLHDFLTGYVDSHQGNYILTPDNDLASIDRAEAGGNNPSADVGAPSLVHRPLKLATGTPQTLDKYRPGEIEVGRPEARAFPLDPEHARSMADAVPQMIAALRRRGMNKEADFVQRRGAVLQAFSEQGGKTVGDLERIARSLGVARFDRREDA